MRNRRFPRLAPFLVAALLSGCAIVPFLPFLPVMGSAYDGYVVWKSGKATKYYPFDLDMTCRAVMRAADQLKIEAMLIKSASKEGYSLETKGTIPVPMRIDILPLEKSIGSLCSEISSTSNYFTDLSMTISTRRQPWTKRKPNESYHKQGFKKRHM
jgi:hypothetical protein